jgi:hypothetical protein
MDSSVSESRIVELTSLLGLENDQRIEKYVAAGKRFQQNWLLRFVLFYGIRAANINDALASWVSERLKEVLIS